MDPNTDKALCQFPVDPSRACSSDAVDQILFECFGERVCKRCKSKSDDFDLITKAEVQSFYLIPEDSIKTMKFMSKPNPHNSHWNQMRLYLRKHAKELSIKRYGNLEKVEEQKKAREQKKFEKEVAKSQVFFEQQTKEFTEELMNDTSKTSQTNAIVGKKRSFLGDNNENGKAAKVGKKKSALKDLINCMAGEKVL